MCVLKVEHCEIKAGLNVIVLQSELWTYLHPEHLNHFTLLSSQLQRALVIRSLPHTVNVSNY